VVAAAVFMVLEMVLLAVAPLHGGIVLLLCCLANRILSGLAEGMASGADEALVFDSLAEWDRSGEWPEVLAQVMGRQGVGLVIAMLVGGAVYDPAFLGRLCSAFGWSHAFAQGTTLRFPIYLNLITALLTLSVVLGLREPKAPTPHVEPEAKGAAGPEAAAWHLVAHAGTWIRKTPVALFVIVAGVMIDSVVRLFLTFSSSYFRLIEIPEAAFGVIGATMGGLGLAVSPLARRMVANNSVARNYVLLSLTVLSGLIGVSCRWRYWGVLFIVPLAGAMMALGYIVSYYLNAVVASSHRATVLSFKGVAFNLGYGFISLIFALVLKAVRDGGGTGAALKRGLVFLPLWVVCGCVICGFIFWRHQKLLRIRL
jgi:hypothetical protein